MNDDRELPPRFPDEVWTVSWDWTPSLQEGETIVGEPTVAAVGSSFTVDQVAFDDPVTRFRVKDGSLSSTARIFLLATLNSGDKVAGRILAPIRYK